MYIYICIEHMYIDICMYIYIYMIAWFMEEWACEGINVWGQQGSQCSRAPWLPHSSPQSSTAHHLRLNWEVSKISLKIERESKRNLKTINPSHYRGIDLGQNHLCQCRGGKWEVSVLAKLSGDKNGKWAKLYIPTGVKPKLLYKHNEEWEKSIESHFFLLVREHLFANQFRSFIS